MAGIVAVGLMVTSAKAGQYITNTSDKTVTVQAISIEGDRNDLSGGGDAIKLPEYCAKKYYDWRGK